MGHSFLRAQQMEFDAAEELYPGKYTKAIEQTRAATQELIESGKLNDALRAMKREAARAAKDAAKALAKAGKSGGGRGGLVLGILTLGFAIGTQPARAAGCVAVEHLAPTTFDAAFNRGESGSDLVGEAGWDALKSVDSVSATNAVEEFLDYTTGVREARFGSAAGKLWSGMRAGMSSGISGSFSEGASGSAELWGAVVQAFR